MPKGQRCDRAEIIRLLNDDVKAKRIADMVGCSLPMVYKVAAEIGHEWKNKNRTKKDAILDDLRNGGGVKAVARRYGAAPETVRKIRDEAGIVREGDNQYGGYGDRLRRAIKVINERASEFDYHSGFVDTDSPVVLRCKSCGELKTVSMRTVRKGLVLCRSCKQAEILKRQADRQAARQDVLAEKQRKKILSEIESSRQLGLRFCVCGALLNSPYRKRCEDCARKFENKNRELARRIKLKVAWVDSDIDVAGLYRRDNGVCWLCGGKCDMNDKYQAGETIICGDSYPSIDHVIPLSKGGLHSWGNVRLAHRICNSLKADRMIEPA